MRRDAHAANGDFDAMAGGEGDAPEARVADALDGDAGDDAQDGEDDEGEQVGEDDKSYEEGGGRHRHAGGAGVIAGAGAIQLRMQRREGWARRVILDWRSMSLGRNVY